MSSVQRNSERTSDKGGPRGLWWWRGAVLLFCLALTFPPYTCFSKHALDAGMEIGLNLASANHLVYGRDVACTYGPLGFVFFPLDIGTNYAQAMVWLVILEIIFLGALALVLSPLRKALDIVLVGLAWTLIGLNFFNTAVPLTVAGLLVMSYHRRQLRWALPAIFLSAFSLLAKFNAGVGNALLLAAWGAAVLVTERRGAAALRVAALAGLYVALVLALFFFCGIKLDGIPEYLHVYWLIAAGYSSAVCLRAAHHADLAAAGAMAGFVLFALWRCCRRHPDAIATLLLAVPIFFAYKSAVIRADAGHLPYGCALAAALLGLGLSLTPGKWERRIFLLLLALTVGGGAYKFCQRPDSIFERTTIVSAALRPQQAACRNAENFKALNPPLPEAWRQKISRRTVDVYPWDIALVYVNQLAWRPRLVLESYSAYEPLLDERGAEHYRGADAPDFVLYRHESLDNAHPCLVDPQTWLEIVRQYDFVEAHDDLFLLERRAKPRWSQEVVLKRETVPLDQTIAVSGRFPGRVALQARVQMTAAGKLAEALYKVAPPEIVVTYETGETRKFRTVWRNLADGFLVSDLPWRPEQAREFFQTGRACPVREIRFQADASLFAKEADLTWLKLR